MSAEAYAEEQFKAACDDLNFLDRLANLGAEPGDTVVVAGSTPAGELLARCDGATVVAALDEDAPHGFALARISEVDR